MNTVMITFRVHPIKTAHTSHTQIQEHPNAQSTHKHKHATSILKPAYTFPLQFADGIDGCRHGASSTREQVVLMKLVRSGWTVVMSCRSSSSVRGMGRANDWEAVSDSSLVLIKKLGRHAQTLLNNGRCRGNPGLFASQRRQQNSLNR